MQLQTVIFPRYLWNLFQSYPFKRWCPKKHSSGTFINGTFKIYIFKIEGYIYLPEIAKVAALHLEQPFLQH